jgi:hypothetical protein
VKFIARVMQNEVRGVQLFYRRKIFAPSLVRNRTTILTMLKQGMQNIILSSIRSGF